MPTWAGRWKGGRYYLDAEGRRVFFIERRGRVRKLRVSAWEAFAPLTPSNLRHTFVTLAAECGELVTFTEGGVDRARIAQTVGHRAGSTMTADRYERVQVPPMIRLPLPWVARGRPPSTRGRSGSSSHRKLGD